MSECQAKTKSGQPCLSHALQDSPYCFRHSPAHARERQQASRRGGLNRRHPNSRPFPAADVTTAAGLIAFNDALIRAAWDNSLPASRLRALGALVQNQVKLLEFGESERKRLEVARIIGPLFRHGKALSTEENLVPETQNEFGGLPSS